VSQADRLIKKLAAALAKRGASLVLSRSNAGAYDPNSSTVAGATTSGAVKGLVESVRQFTPDRQLERGSSVERAAWKVTLANSGLPFAPDKGDLIGPIDGRTCKVVGLTSDRLGDQVVSYVLRVSA
jgi:hypothetical protein